ncbi:MAG: aldehyde ferredoxin oxidoreductase family protein [Thermoplasmata archaeon]
MAFSLGGYAGQSLHVDLTRGRIRKLPLSEVECRRFLGGRGLDAKTIFDMVPPGTNPLGPRNVVCISAGPVAGLLGPTTGRVNVASKSPLTGIYGNANAGTNFGAEMKYAGYDRIVLTGRAKKPVYLSIEDENVEIRSAEHLSGEGVFETTYRLQEENNGYDTKVAAVGPAAEKGVLYGSVIFDYWDAAGRAGIGSVLASKNLKGIAVTGTGELRAADPDRYWEVIREGWRGILEEPGFRTGEHSSLGTLVCVGWGNAQGWLATRNYTEGEFNGAELISGEEFRDRLSTKDTPIPGGRACLSCPNRCKRFGRIEKGKYAGTKGNIEFEGVGAFGSKCGVSDIEAVFHAYMLANDYGMDCISCGNSIAFFMELTERGILTKKDAEGLDLRFGNAEAMVEMVHRIGTVKTKLGKLGAIGTRRAARGIGKGASRYETTIKGMETIVCDPRASKGFGFSYAVASRGSDHLRAHPVFEMLRIPKEVGEEIFGSGESTTLRSYRGKVNMVVWHENVGAVSDSMGTCRFMHASYYAGYPIPEMLAKVRGRKEAHSIKYHDWIAAATGMELDYYGMLEMGDRIINLERAINVRFGVRRKDDMLPRRFIEEPLSSGPAKGQRFPEGKLRKMIDQYYRIRGWDLETGLPYGRKLVSAGLKDVAQDLRKRKLLAGR